MPLDRKSGCRSAHISSSMEGRRRFLRAAVRVLSSGASHTCCDLQRNKGKRKGKRSEEVERERDREMGE